MSKDFIVIHCSATRENQNYTFDQLCQDHIKRKFKGPGYHVYIRRDGKTHLGRSFHQPGAHVKGHNSNSIGVCYEGGLDENGKPKDTRTEAQMDALLNTILFLKTVFPKAIIKGHRDFSPDKNGDGIISPNEYIKECPCFDAYNEFIVFNQNLNG